MKDMESRKIDWTRYFDRIWCINYIPYKDRREAIQKEFDRVGISNHPNFCWNNTIDSPWFKFIMQCLNSTGKGRLLNENELKCALGHYGCMKRSLYYGDSRILIVEDDARFLKDLPKIEEILENMPKDYDVILFDWFMHCSSEEFSKYIQYRKINNHYAEYENLASCGCYSLKLEGIKKLLNIYEQILLPSDVYISKLRIPNFKKAFSIHQISCQVTYRKSMSFNNAGTNTIHKVYQKANLNYNDYNMNDEKPYGYGDFVIENH